MSLVLPGKIPIAARNLEVLESKGKVHKLRIYDLQKAAVLQTKDATDGISIWASPSLSGYRSVWRQASLDKWVDPIEEWGEGTDIDHVYPKSWSLVPGMKMAYVRLFPVWAEVNRSAGAGREKTFLHKIRSKPLMIADIVYADELQVLKIIGHPVGTSSQPEAIFDSKSSKKKR